MVLHHLYYLQYGSTPDMFPPVRFCTVDNPNTTQTLEYTKDKYNVKIIKRKVSPKVSPTIYIGRRIKERRCEGDERIITIKRKVEDFNVYEMRIEWQWETLRNTVHAVTLG
jgi:hypothetical protein